MEAIIRYTEGVKFEAECRGHKVLCDQPVGNGGEDAGMSPPEFLLASLGTCAGFYALQYLKTRSLPVGGLNVRVSAEKASHPARLGSFRIEVAVPQLEAHHQEGILRAVKLCLVHNTLLHTPQIETVLVAKAAS
jgi:putative redox protein